MGVTWEIRGFAAGLANYLFAAAPDNFPTIEPAVWLPMNLWMVTLHGDVEQVRSRRESLSSVKQLDPALASPRRKAEVASAPAQGRACARSTGVHVQIAATISRV